MIYYISMLSTTGGKLKVSPKNLNNYLTLKDESSKNAVIGFGITKITLLPLEKVMAWW